MRAGALCSVATTARKQGMMGVGMGVGMGVPAVWNSHTALHRDLIREPLKPQIKVGGAGQATAGKGGQRSCAAALVREDSAAAAVGTW